MCLQWMHEARDPSPRRTVPLNLISLALAHYTGTEVAVAPLDMNPMFSIESEGGKS